MVNMRPAKTVDVNTCRQILEKTFPQINIQRLSAIQSGWDTLALDINDDFIFRFPRRPELEAQLEKEIDLLSLLGKALPARVPQVEFACRKSAGDEHTLLGYPKIQGIGLDAVPMVSRAVERQLGEFLTALHRYPIEGVLAILGGPIGPQDWHKQYEETYAWIQKFAFPLLPLPDRLATSLLWEVFLSSEDNFSFQPALIHGDLEPEHILCEPDGSAITGIIDWGDARLGDAALDFAGLFFLGGEPLVDRTLSFYQGQVDDTFRRRVRFYHNIAPFYEIRYALDIGDGTLLRRAIQALSRGLRV
jgi:aminoglycoside 2''-phosphotransferase